MAAVHCAGVAGATQTFGRQLPEVLNSELPAAEMLAINGKSRRVPS